MDRMMVVRALIGFLYRTVAKPILFLFDAEVVHDAAVAFGAHTGNFFVVPALLRYEHAALRQTIDGIAFENPVGLAAGFDYNGRLAHVMGNVGFGFHTVGTVTALPYKGNDKPRLGRLPRSKALFVNKGFKSSGASAVHDYLASLDLSREIVGVSVGASNIKEIDTVDKAIADYCKTFDQFRDADSVSYFELNISCPNTRLEDPFLDPAAFMKLARAVSDMRMRQPIWIKMPSELSWEKTRAIMDIALKHGMRTFIFSNLVKDRNNASLDRRELERFRGFKGNFSGKPVERPANDLLTNAYACYGDEVVLVGCGGIFSARDAYEKIKRGAHLVQLITGMIYQGPQLAAEINEGLVFLAHADGFESVSTARGSAVTHS